VPLLRRRRAWRGNVCRGHGRSSDGAAALYDADDYLWTEDDDDDDYSLSSDVMELSDSASFLQVRVFHDTTPAEVLLIWVFCTCCCLVSSIDYKLSW